MLDRIQEMIDDWFDTPFGSIITIVVFLGLFGLLMDLMINVLRPHILAESSNNSQHCEESK